MMKNSGCDIPSFFAMAMSQSPGLPETLVSVNRLKQKKMPLIRHLFNDVR